MCFQNRCSLPAGRRSPKAPAASPEATRHPSALSASTLRLLNPRLRLGVGLVAGRLSGRSRRQTPGWTWDKARDQNDQTEKEEAKKTERQRE